MKRLILVTLLVLAACSRDGVNPWLGYVEGEDALISPPQPGWITHLVVQRGQPRPFGHRERFDVRQ